jgi:hypothetical protein
MEIQHCVPLMYGRSVTAEGVGWVLLLSTSDVWELPFEVHPT